MTIQPVTSNLPAHLYNRLKRRAEQAHRTVEAELLEVVASAVPVADERRSQRSHFPLDALGR